MPREGSTEPVEHLRGHDAMTLRRKTLALVSLTLAALLAVLTLVTRELLDRGFLQLEEDQARRDLQRTLNAFQDDLAQLSASVEDYAAWDRMVDFAEGRGRALLATEFVPLTLQNLRLNGIVILDDQRRPLFTYGLDPGTLQAAPVPSELLEELSQPGSLLLRHADAASSVSGVLPAKRFPLLVASHPIVTSEGLGPIRGSVVFARYLTPAAQQKLAEVTHLSIGIRPVSDGSLPADISDALVALGAGRPEVVRPLDRERVASYALIRSLHKQPALVVRVDAPRSVVHQGRVTVRYLVAALLTAGLGFAALMIGILEWSVLAPLSRLREGVNRVASSHDLSLRMPEDGLQEFAGLANTVNCMLSTLEHSERELRSAEAAAQRASHAKSDLLANVSHEIRTPMNGVMGMVELLARTPLTPLQQHYIETMRGSGDALLQLLNDVLDLSKMEAGQFSLTVAPADLTAVVQQAVEVFEARAQAKGIDLIVQCAPGVPPLVAIDAVRVRQVLLNLVGNAVKFTESGYVRVELSATPAADGTRMVGVTIAVHDTGCGIEEAHLERIFDKFAQAENAHGSGGTGLGLTISRQLAVLMGGDILVDSVVGSGSTFRLVFAAPAAETAVPGTDADTKSAPVTRVSLDGRRVLLAEDNLVNQEVARLMLESMGCVVDVVGDGEAALARVRERSYDVILLDCRMPRLDGRRAASAIRALGGCWRHVPIIAVTADVLEGERESCLKAGMDAVVIKPLRLDDLRAALEARVGATQPVLPSMPSRSESPSDGDRPDHDIDTAVLAKLQRLRRPDGTDLIGHLVALFLEDGPARLEAMARAIDAGDPKALRESAHALKGTCGTLGAARLRAVSAEMEARAGAGSLDGTDELLREARAAFDRAEAAFDALVNPEPDKAGPARPSA